MEFSPLDDMSSPTEEASPQPVVETEIPPSPPQLPPPPPPSRPSPLVEPVYAGNLPVQPTRAQPPLRLPPHLHTQVTVETSPAPTHRPKKRASNFTQEEVMHLLRILEDVVPVCKREWESVLDTHSERFPGRDTASIRRKLQGLHRKKMPTGDPDMPEEVRLAKEVRDLIGAKARISTADEEYDMEGEGTFLTVDGVARTAAPVVVNNRNIGSDIDSVSITTAENGSLARNIPGSVGGNGSSNSGGRRGGRKPDLMELFFMQSQEEAKIRAHEAREASKDRQAMMSMVTNIATGYFNMKSNERAEDNNQRRRKKRRRGMSQMGGGYSYIDTSSSDDEDSVENAMHNAAEARRRAPENSSSTSRRRRSAD